MSALRPWIEGLLEGETYESYALLERLVHVVRIWRYELTCPPWYGS